MGSGWAGPSVRISGGGEGAKVQRVRQGTAGTAPAAGRGDLVSGLQQGQFVDGEEAYRHLQTCKACRKAFEVAFNYLRTCPPECRRFFRHWLKKLAEDPPRAK